MMPTLRMWEGMGKSVPGWVRPTARHNEAVNFEHVIRRRRDGEGNTEEELQAVALGAAQGNIPDYQLSAWLMAEFFHPLNSQETAWFTKAMADSGERVDLAGLPKPWVDKHSTGGVGDKTSIV